MIRIQFYLGTHLVSSLFGTGYKDTGTVLRSVPMVVIAEAPLLRKGGASLYCGKGVRMPKFGRDDISESSHYGRWVHIQSDERPEGTWECNYTIFEMGLTRSSSMKRKHAGSFWTREEAESAAMDAAEAELRARGPLI